MEVLASLVLLRSKLRGIEPLCSDFDSDVVPASQSHVLARQNKSFLRQPTLKTRSCQKSPARRTKIASNIIETIFAKRRLGRLFIVQLLDCLESIGGVGESSVIDDSQLRGWAGSRAGL